MATELATVDDMAAFLQVAISSQTEIASALRALAEASAVVRNYTRQHISLVEDDELVFYAPSGHLLLLPELPVVAVASVVAGETELVNTDYQLRRFGFLHRLGGRTWANWLAGGLAGDVTVTYTHGYETIPDDVAGVVTRAASRAYQAGLRAADTAAVPGLIAKSLGDYSVSFAAGAGEEGASMGASAAPMLLASERAILDAYRVKGA